MIQVCGLHVHYPETHALRGVDLTVADGSFVLVGGPSGGGKSTLANALTGLIPQAIPTMVEGRVTIEGLDTQQHGVAELAARVGLVFQIPALQLFSGTVGEEVAFGPRNLGLSAAEVAARVSDSLHATGCSALRARMVRRLSAGEQQRVVIAATLAMRPSVLILDEPAANLDQEGVHLLLEALVRLNTQFGVTIVVIEHRLEPFLPYADRLVWLAEGRVAADGRPAETLAQVQPASPPARPLPIPSDEPLVALRNVSAAYNGRSVLRDCSLVLRRGEFAALVGSNGAGKTTLARVLAGLLRPRRGRVAWHKRRGRETWRVGFLQQTPLHQLVCDTVEAEVEYGLRNLRMGKSGRAKEILERTDLLDLRHRSTQALSVGQQQRTVLAATLALYPELLILDEPTVGQGRDHLRRVMDLVSDLNGRGRTVLLITHNRALIEQYAHRVWRLSDGQIQEVA